MEAVELITVGEAEPREENYLALERGDILYFPRTPFAFGEDERELLRSTGLSSSSHHKNVAYRPEEDKVTGYDPAAVARSGETAGSDARVLRAGVGISVEAAAALHGKSADRLRELPAPGRGRPRLANQEAQRSAAYRRVSHAADARRSDPAILHQYSCDQTARLDSVGPVRRARAALCKWRRVGRGCASSQRVAGKPSSWALSAESMRSDRHMTGSCSVFTII